MKNHTVFESTEYETLLIAAGWVDIGSCDPEYLRYSSSESDPMPYDHWVGMREEWNRLNDAYDLEFPDPQLDLTYLQRSREHELLDLMSRIEYLLGY